MGRGRGVNASCHIIGKSKIARGNIQQTLVILYYFLILIITN